MCPSREIVGTRRKNGLRRGRCRHQRGWDSLKYRGPCPSWSVFRSSKSFRDGRKSGTAAGPVDLHRRGCLPRCLVPQASHNVPRDISPVPGRCAASQTECVPSQAEATLTATAIIPHSV